MATFTTPLFDAQAETRVNPSRLAVPNVASGEVEFAVIPYTLAGTEVANDIIKLGLLPPACIPLPQLSKVTCATDPGTAFTVKVGTAADDDGFAAVVATSIPGDVPFCLAGAAQPAWLAQTPVVPDSGSGNAVVFATVTTATALTPGTVIYFTLAWKRGR